MTVLASGLVLVEENQDSVIGQRLFDLFKNLQAQATDSIVDEMYKFYSAAAFGETGELANWAPGLTTLLFKGAKLTNLSEKRFFEEVFKKVQDADIQELIAQTCATIDKYTPGMDRAVQLAAKRAAFLAGVWPERKAEIVSAIPTDVLMSFPTKSREWQQINTALQLKK
jgi:hypothetical protein